MSLPLKLRGASKEKRVNYAVKMLMSSRNFNPSKKYDLMVRVGHDWPDHMPTGNGMLRMNEHWEKVSPLRKVHIPRERDASRSKMSIEEMKTKEKFVNWFEEKFQDLPAGVYGILQSQGKGHGNIPMFVLRFENGKVVDWKKRSNSQKGAGVGETANLLGLPYYFQTLRRVGVRFS